MPHATSRRSDSRTHSDVGEKPFPAAKTCRTLFEELNGADQAAGDAASATVPVATEKSHSQQPLETIFLESCDITEVDVSFDEVPVELTVMDDTATEGSFLVKAQSELPSRGGAETVTAVPLVSGWSGSEPTHVASSRPETQPPPSWCTECHHTNVPLTVRQKRFEYLQTMCGPSPALPELLSTPEPLSERCDWKIQSGTIGDWRKCPERPPPTYEQRFSGSQFRLLEARRRELHWMFRERAARKSGIPVHLYVPQHSFFEWPAPPGLDW